MVPYFQGIWATGLICSAWIARRNRDTQSGSCVGGVEPTLLMQFGTPLLAQYLGYSDTVGVESPVGERWSRPATTASSTSSMLSPPSRLRTVSRPTVLREATMPPEMAA